MPDRRASTRSALTVAGVVVAAVLAGLLALVVNIGILRAAGSPPGPGRLDRTSVERPTREPQASPGDRSPQRAGGDGRTPSPAARTFPGPSVAPSSVSPAPDRSAPEREFGSGADD